MELLGNWKEVLQKAWSIKLMVLSAILSAVEQTLPLFSDFVPPGIFAVLSLIAVMAAGVARLLAQQGDEDA